MSELRPVRILAVDGGGIRGIVPATVLVELQRRLPRPIVDYFDVVAGTSTGGLVASAVCAPGPSGGPRYTAEQILEFYLRDCRQIFHRNLGWAVESLGGLRRPKYPARGIDAFLVDRFGDTELRHALKPLVMVSYDLTRRAPWVFSSVLAAEEASRNYLLRDACRASTAAPTYFPAATVRSLAGDTRELVDGGVCANDPVLAAFVVAERLHPGRPLLLVSLGTGKFTNPIDGAAAKRWGLAGWAWRLLDLLSDGQSAMSEATMHRLLGVATRADSRYHRVQPDLPAGLGRMDDTSQENVAGLERITRQHCARHAARLDAIAAELAA
jgi:patatin-like phospholipase/acyl hydrolase